MKILRHLFAPGPASGLQHFEEVIDKTLAKKCARPGCAHPMDDHGPAYGPLPSFRRDQCLACDCPGFLHVGPAA